jgi:hypothetical protein
MVVLIFFIFDQLFPSTQCKVIRALKAGLKVHKHETIFLTFFQKLNPYGPEGL